MSREKFPGEVTYPNSEEWRAGVKSWMDRTGTTREMLREQLGVNQATISKVLSGRISKSTLIGPISRLSGVPLPKRMDDLVSAAALALATIKESDADAFESFHKLIMGHPAVKRQRR